MIITYGCVAMLALSATALGDAPKNEAPSAAQRSTAPRPRAARIAKPAATAAAKPMLKKTAAKKDPTAALLDKVQGYYAKIEDYRADFIQIYTKVALSRTTEQRGELMLKKPGSMRWTYKKPVEKLWVVDGDTLYVVDPEFEQVFVDKNFKTEELQNSISFLWGRGKLDTSFDAKIGKAETYKATKGHEVLELRPKAGATYSKMVLIVDSASGAVTESIIYETAGNTNHFKFNNAKHNTKLADGLFKYTPPANFEVIQR